VSEPTNLNPASCPCGFPTRRLHSGGAECHAWIGRRALLEGAPARSDHRHAAIALESIDALLEQLQDERRALVGDVDATALIAQVLLQQTPLDVVRRIARELERHASEADYEGRPTVRLLHRMGEKLAAAELAERRRRGPQSHAERAVGGERLELGRDGGGRRHFLAGRAINCGTTLEWNRGGIWTAVRYEVDMHADPEPCVVLCDAIGEHVLEDGDRFRWPARSA